MAMNRLAPLIALTLAAGCGGETPRLPTAPSELTTGIIVYEHANFRGESAHITSDVDDLSDFIGPCEHEQKDSDFLPGGVSYDWNDCISSVRVAPGWRVTLYRGTRYRDDSLDISADVANLVLAPHDCDHGGLNDCVSSIRVSRR